MANIDLPITLRALSQSDYTAVATIYQAGIDTGNATFETQAKDWMTWDETMLPHSRLVVVQGEQVLGWAALSGVSNRCVYNGVAEVSVYVDPQAQGKGVGKQLLQALIESSKDAGIWTLQARTMAENTASIALHQKLGFKLLGIHEKLSQLHGIWRDVAALERRSPSVGR